MNTLNHHYFHTKHSTFVKNEDVRKVINVRMRLKRLQTNVYYSNGIQAVVAE